MQNNNGDKVKSRANNPLIVIIIIGALVVGLYYVFSYERDKYIANKVYQQMINLDTQMNKLQESAAAIKAEKTNDSMVINAVSSLTRDNFMDNRDHAISVVKELANHPDIESNLIAELSAMNSLPNFKINIKKAKTEIRILKYQHNQQVNEFNQQITDITQQVSEMKQQISRIKGTNLHNLELAKLHFISRKLAKTVSDLHDSIVQEILDDAVDNAQKAKDDTNND